MSIPKTIVYGLRQALATPRLILLLWLISVLYALPVTLMMKQALADSFAATLSSEQMRDGFDLGWHAEFEADGGAFEKTFRPTVTGAGAVLDNLEDWWSGRLFTGYPGLVALGVGYALLWAFLLGGVLDHMVRRQATAVGRPFTLDRFFAAGGRYGLRFLGLTALGGVLYFLIYRLARWLFATLEELCRDVTQERTVLFWVLVVVALVIFLLSIVRMVFDYAKIAMVVGEQWGVLRSLRAGLRTVLAQPLRTFGVYLGCGALGALLVGLYALLAPGAGQSTGLTIVLAFVFSQLYLVARLVVRLGLLGAEMGIYRDVR